MYKACLYFKGETFTKQNKFCKGTISDFPRQMLHKFDGKNSSSPNFILCSLRPVSLHGEIFLKFKIKFCITLFNNKHKTIEITICYIQKKVSIAVPY